MYYKFQLPLQDTMRRGPKGQFMCRQHISFALPWKRQLFIFFKATLLIFPGFRVCAAAISLIFPATGRIISEVEAGERTAGLFSRVILRFSFLLH